MSTRPSYIDQNIMEAAAKRLVKDLYKWELEGLEHDERDRVTEESWWKAAMRMIDNCRHNNGYELAKILDDSFWVEPDFNLVELLEDNPERYLDEELKKATEEWIKNEKIQSPFKVGDLVTVKMRKGVGYIQGEITRVYENEAKVCVFISQLGHVKDGIGSHGWVMSYEECKPVVVDSGEKQNTDESKFSV